MKMNFNRKSNFGFTLIELLVVVAIIAILMGLVLAALSGARGKGSDGAIKSNLRSAIGQGEVLYNTRTANINSYTNACTNGMVDGALGVGGIVLAAAKTSSLTTYGINTTGTTTTATCNDSANAWAAEVPLKSISGMWCVDSLGHSEFEAASFLAATVCN